MRSGICVTRLRLAEISTSDTIVDQSAGRNAAEIVRLMRRIRARYETPADARSVRVIRARRAITSRAVRIDRCSNQRSRTCADRRAGNGVGRVAVMIISVPAGIAADRSAHARSDKGASSGGGFARVKTERAHRGERYNC
jgi:hypothetical protein